MFDVDCYNYNINKMIKTFNRFVKIIRLNLSRFSENTSDIQETNSVITDEGETPDTSTNSVSIYQRNSMVQQSAVSTIKRSQEPSLLNISRKRLKMSKSLASPRSSISTTSTISLPNSTNQQLKNKKKR